MRYAKSQQTRHRKKKSKSSLDRKKLIRSLDDIIREILHRVENKCYVCGRKDTRFSKENPYGLQVGHYITRQKYAVRWSVHNVHLQCTYCNGKHRFDTFDYTHALVTKNPEAIYAIKREMDEYSTLYKTGIKNRDLLAKLAELREKLNSLM